MIWLNWELPVPNVTSRLSHHMICIAAHYVKFACRLNLPQISAGNGLVFFRSNRHIRPSLRTIGQELIVNMRQQLNIIGEVPTVLPSIAFISQRNGLFIRYRRISRDFRVLHVGVNHRRRGHRSAMCFTISGLQSQQIGHELQFKSIIHILGRHMSTTRLVVDNHAIGLIIPCIFVDAVNLTDESQVTVFTKRDPNRIPASLTTKILL